MSGEKTLAEFVGIASAMAARNRRDRQRITLEAGGSSSERRGPTWTEAELEAVLDLFDQLGGKGIHETNPRVIALARRLHRPIRAVEAQLLMFRNLQRGGNYSRGHMSRLCREVWSKRHGGGSLRPDVLQRAVATVAVGDVQLSLAERTSPRSDCLVRTPNVEPRSMMNETVQCLVEVAKGGSRVAAVPGMHSLVGGLPEGQAPAGVAEALHLIESRMRDAAASGVAEWVFLVGGPGNGKSHQLIRLLDRLRAAGVHVPEFATGQAARRLPLISRGAATLLVINDATIRGLGDYPDEVGHLACDMRRALQREPRSSHMLCNVNRGILIEELAAVRGKNGWQVYEAILEWLVHPRRLPADNGIVRPRLNACDYFASASVVIDNREACRVHAVQMDVLSLLEQLPGGGTERAVTGLDGPTPEAKRYHRAGFNEDRWESPIGKLVASVAAEDRFERGGCGQCTARDLCPMLANARFLRREVAGGALLKLMRGAEIASGRLFNYRDAWCVISHAVIGGPPPAGLHPCEWVKDRVGLVRRAEGRGQSGSRDRREAVVELELRRVQHVLFPNRLPTPYFLGFRASRLEHRSVPESVSRLAAVDPALDVSPSWCGPVSDLLEEGATPEDVARRLGEEGRLPAGCISQIDLLFEQELRGYLRSEKTKEKDRRIHVRWYGTSLYRWYAMVLGRVAYQEVLDEWSRVYNLASRKQSHAELGKLGVGLSRLLFPSSLSNSSTLFPLFRPRVEPIRGQPERPLLAVSVSQGEPDSIRLQFDAVGDHLFGVMRGGPGQAELAGIPIDLLTAREAVANCSGDGFTDAAVASIPRVERLRAKLVLPGKPGVAQVLVGGGVHHVPWKETID